MPSSRHAVALNPRHPGFPLIRKLRIIILYGRIRFRALRRVVEYTPRTDGGARENARENPPKIPKLYSIDFVRRCKTTRRLSLCTPPGRRRLRCIISSPGDRSYALHDGKNGRGGTRACDDAHNTDRTGMIILARTTW